PSGYDFTIPNVTTTEENSKVDPSTGQTPVFTVSAGEMRYDLDAGLVPAGLFSPVATITGHSWNDQDGDGVQTTGESAQAGQVVYLYTSDGNLLYKTMTATDGSYSVPIPATGDYYVQIDKSDDLQFSPAGQGDDATADSDFDESGFSPLLTIQGGESLVLDAG